MGYNVSRSSGLNKTVETVINYNDISTAATTNTYEAVSLPIYGIVKQVTYVLDTEFDGGATSELTIQIGDGTDPNGYIEAKSVHADSTAVFTSLVDGAYLNDSTTDNVVNGKQYAAADTLDVLFTATGANLDALTAGSLRVIVEYLDVA
jgi:hypothetical protein